MTQGNGRDGLSTFFCCCQVASSADLRFATKVNARLFRTQRQNLLKSGLELYA